MSQRLRVEASPAPSQVSTGIDGKLPATRQYELSLVATVPAARHGLVRQILSGVAAHRPNFVRERHLKFQPNKIAAPQAAADQGGGSQTIQDNAKVAAARKRALQSGRDGQSWFMEAIETMCDSYDEHLARENGPASSPKPAAWVWKWSGLPDPTMKTVNARSIDASTLVGIDPSAHAEAQDYKFKFQFGLEGEQWVYQNVVIFMYRIHRWPEAAQSVDTSALNDDSLIDTSKQYLVEAKVTLEDGNNNELINKGLSELTSFKDMMQGSLDLKPVDRLALDTRAR